MILEYTLSQTPDTKLFERFTYTLIAMYESKLIEELEDPDNRYTDIRVKDIVITLHQNVYTGIQVFIKKSETTSETQSNLLASIYIFLKYWNKDYFTNVAFAYGKLKEIISINDLIVDIKNNKSSLDFRYYRGSGSYGTPREHCIICEDVFEKDSKEYSLNSDTYSVCTHCSDIFIFNDSFTNELEKLPRFTTSFKQLQEKRISTCACLKLSFDFDDYYIENLGIDESRGRYGEVSMLQCKICKLKWLHYSYENEGITSSGRWYRAVIFTDDKEDILPQNAIKEIESKPWYFYGGSYFGSDVSVGKGKIYL